MFIYCDDRSKGDRYYRFSWRALGSYRLWRSKVVRCTFSKVSGMANKMIGRGYQTRIEVM